jgi:hypothetical protein
MFFNQQNFVPESGHDLRLRPRLDRGARPHWFDCPIEGSRLLAKKTFGLGPLALLPASAVASAMAVIVVLNIGSLLRIRSIKPGRRSEVTQGATPGTKNSRKGVASVALIAAIDIEDVAIGEPGNLIIPAKNLIFRAQTYGSSVSWRCGDGWCAVWVIGKHKI